MSITNNRPNQVPTLNYSEPEFYAPLADASIGNLIMDLWELGGHSQDLAVQFEKLTRLPSRKQMRTSAEYLASRLAESSKLEELIISSVGGSFRGELRMRALQTAMIYHGFRSSAQRLPGEATDTKTARTALATAGRNAVRSVYNRFPSAYDPDTRGWSKKDASGDLLKAIEAEHKEIDAEHAAADEELARQFDDDEERNVPDLIY